MSYKIILSDSVTKAVLGVGETIVPGVENPLDFEPLVKVHANRYLNRLLSAPTQMKNNNLIINARTYDGKRVWYTSCEDDNNENA